MFGWEFPPYSSGGLGTACYGLTRSLAKKGTKITFVLPYYPGEMDFLDIISTNITFKRVSSPLRPYLSSARYAILRGAGSTPAMYGESLFDEVYRYGEEAKKIAAETEFDVIHCHDWMTFMAGIFSKQLKHKPLVVHVHSTEFDRTGGNSVNQYVYDIERYGMEQADLVIAVSNFTKRIIMQHYGIPEWKIKVVHNAVDPKTHSGEHVPKREKLVLFLGRITLQKGPDYFLYAAKKVLEHDPDVKFIIAGKGDMERFIIEKSAELGISRNVLFAGFLSGKDIERAYRMADLYVMPSVSEPFGITALEAIQLGTPVLISKQSGVSEVIKHALKADFWDVNDLANKILAVLRYRSLHHVLQEHSSQEIAKFSWDTPAQKCIDIYNQLLH
jgi:glycosyltransferase involved in cell wall biosynthesis